MTSPDVPSTHPLFRGERRPPDGAERLAERVTRLAAAALRAPMASLAVGGDDGLYVKRCVGFPAAHTPRPGSPFLCPLSRHVFASSAPLVVPDVPAHPLGAGHAGLAALGVRAYLGVPLRTGGGTTLGMLSVFAHEPRQWTASDEQLLGDLAALVVEDCERRDAGLAASAARRRRAAGGGANEPRREARRWETMGRLAGGIAHDFNNVLAAITGYSRIALRSLPGAGEPNDDVGVLPPAVLRQLRSDVEEIVAAATRGAALTAQLLAFARPAPGEPAVAALDAVVAEVVAMARPLLGAGIDVGVAQGAAAARARIAPAQLRQLLLDLLLHARDALPRGGTVTVETHRGAADSESSAERLSLVVRRDGADASPEAVAWGDLGSAREIAGLAGGEIVVERGQGRGLAVRVELPAAAGEAPTNGAARPSANDDARREATVLLVEDEPSVRQLATTVLGRLGYRVVPAAGGAEALRLLDALAADDLVPELLVTDVTMPGMSGTQLAGEVVRRQPGIAVLYMSGYGEPAPPPDATSTARAAFLQKPFAIEDLAARVRELLEGAPR